MTTVKRSSDDKLEFPSLFSSQELDQQHIDQKAHLAPKVEQYYPLPVVEARFPRIAEAIQSLWGTPELDSYFDKLLIDERGDRAGFPAEVVQALLALSNQHIECFGYRTLADAWTVDPKTHRQK